MPQIATVTVVSKMLKTMENSRIAKFNGRKCCIIVWTLSWRMHVQCILHATLHNDTVHRCHKVIIRRVTARHQIGKLQTPISQARFHNFTVTLKGGWFRTRTQPPPPQLPAPMGGG